MKRKAVGGRPTLAESLAKRPVDEKQRKLFYNLGLSAPSSRTANDAEKWSTTSATGNDVPSPSVSGSSSGAFLAEGDSDIGSSVSCRVANASSSFWMAEIERMRQKYELEMQSFKSFILREVDDVVRKLVDQVVDAHALSGTRRFYHKYEREDRAGILKAFEELQAQHPEKSKAFLVRRLQERTSNCALSYRKLHRWSHAGPLQKPGPRVNAAFELRVLDSLVYSTLEKVDDEERAAMVANVVYSHDIIRVAARKVAATPEFVSCPYVSKLKFSADWIKGWLHRRAMRKRRCSTQLKELPKPEEVQARMAQVQKRIDDGKYEANQILSGDETAMLFGQAPRYQYIPTTAGRACTPECDEKARFTTFLSGTAEGMLPSLSILKCASKSAYDLSKTTTVQNLQKKRGFTEQDGWSFGWWERTLDVPSKKGGQPISTKCRRPYLIHNSEGHVITIQNNAWMDTVGMVMLCDLVLEPISKQRGGLLLVWDNCGPHKVRCVQEAFAAAKIAVEELPPRMTGELQVMDLVVNGPLKAAIRRSRTRSLFNFFQLWKIRRLTALAEGTEPPAFQPPKPKVEDGLAVLFECLRVNLTTPQFVASLDKVFVRVGLKKSAAAADYVKYTSHSVMGTVSPMDVLVGKREKCVFSEQSGTEAATFGEIATEFIVQSRNAVMEDNVCLEETEGVEEDMGEPGDSEGDEGEEA